VFADLCAGAGRVVHVAVAGVDSGVCAVGAGADDDQVTGLHVCSGERGAPVLLFVRFVREYGAGGRPVDVAGEAGAVEGGRSGRAVTVWFADVFACFGHHFGPARDHGDLDRRGGNRRVPVASTVDSSVHPRRGWADGEDGLAGGVDRTGAGADPLSFPHLELDRAAGDALAGPWVGDRGGDHECGAPR
jgi:hypothetical protein